MCSKCGVNESRTKMGVPVCFDCTSFGVCVPKVCACGRPFKTRNKSTRCSRCAYQRKKELDAKTCEVEDCDRRIDRRSKRCVPHRIGTGRPELPIGSKRLESYGYVTVKTEDGWQREHSYVLAEKLGRPLGPGESAHHINGVRTDNRPENLELWVVRQPSGQRAKDLLAWAREIEATYGHLNLD